MTKTRRRKRVSGGSCPRRPKCANAEKSDKTAASRMRAGVKLSAGAEIIRNVRNIPVMRRDFANPWLHGAETSLFCAATTIRQMSTAR